MGHLLLTYSDTFAIGF